MGEEKKGDSLEIRPGAAPLSWAPVSGHVH